MLYFTSDLHFFHKNILKYTKRPYKHLDDMHAAIITEWNSTVQATDTVYHLGDFAFAAKNKAGAVLDILAQLNGTIVLLQGNHDDLEMWQRLVEIAPHMCELVAPHEIALAISKVRLVAAPYLEISQVLGDGVGKTKIIMCHYPIASWNFQQYGAVHLHGHMHGGCAGLVEGKALDVGLDSLHGQFDMLRPISIDEVAAYMAKKPVLRRHGAER